MKPAIDTTRDTDDNGSSSILATVVLMLVAGSGWCEGEPECSTH